MYYPMTLFINYGRNKIKISDLPIYFGSSLLQNYYNKIKCDFYPNLTYNKR